MKARCREKVKFRFAQRTPYDRWEVFEHISYAYTISWFSSDYSPNNAHQTIEKNSNNLEKTQTTSTGCELERDELYRLYYTRYHAIRYEIKQPVHEKNERSFDQLIDHVRTLHTILHQTVFWFSTRWKLRQLAHEKWDHVDTESKRRRGALGEATLMQGEELDCKRIQGRDSRRLSRMWSCWACENLRIKRAYKQTRNASLRERSALSSEK